MSKPTITTDYLRWLALIGIAVLLFEVTFFNNGVIFSAILSGIFIYFGRKKLDRSFYKVVFWFGWITLGITILTSMTFKFLLLAIILYFVIHYFKSKNNPKEIQPVIMEESAHSQFDEPIIKKQSLFDNALFGRNQTPDHVYEWQDINIQTGVGDTIIDLSNTVLPKGESVISIRNFIGNVQILIPYEMDVSIHHSVIIGSTAIFQHDEPKAFNQTILYQTQDFQEANQKVKIITSMIIGDIEVKRK